MYSILFFLDYCIFVIECKCRIRGCSDFCAKRSVFLEGFKVTLLVVCVVICFGCIVETQKFMGTGCSSWIKSEPV